MKYLSIVLLFTISITASAQKLSYGVEAGIAVGKQLPRYEAISSWGCGVRVGGNIDYTLPCQVVFSSGLFFEQKRTELYGKTVYPAHANNNWDTMWTKVHRLNYLQLPLLIGYDIDW
ncbi:MAG: PorT family protein [Bacteroides sp.]|nr:PorT family protein [Bacteroides sp.]